MECFAVGVTRDSRRDEQDETHDERRRTTHADRQRAEYPLGTGAYHGGPQLPGRQKDWQWKFRRAQNR